jgi:hypothetical protein
VIKFLASREISQAGAGPCAQYYEDDIPSSDAVPHVQTLTDADARPDISRLTIGFSLGAPRR